MSERESGDAARLGEVEECQIRDINGKSWSLSNREGRENIWFYLFNNWDRNYGQINQIRL